MADEDKRVAYTTGIGGNLIVGDLEITPEGTEVTREQWTTVRDAAAQARLHVSLDKDFENKGLEATINEDGSATTAPPVADVGTTVDGTDASGSTTKPARSGRG